MGSTQKYSLKWNDFTINVASTFRDLHSRHDFVDVTLACADGSTLEAHKVILSSVSTYFRDILKTTPCKHPIIILKDTGRDEASAMLEFAYTGEVNVAQELLPSLLQTARSFRIKGLDKVESPIAEPPPVNPRMETPSSEHWAESAPPTRSHTPSSIHSQQDVKPPFPDGHFLANEKTSPTVRDHSPPPSLPSSQPPTREPSPAHQSSGQNSRTPPPKRWKRSFDMTNGTGRKESSDIMPMIPEPYKTEYEPPKTRPCFERTREIPYPHSMPTSPTMFERGNEPRLAHLFHQRLINPPQNNGIHPQPHIPSAAVAGASAAAQKPDSASRILNQQQQQQQQQPSSLSNSGIQQQATSTSGDHYNALDLCYNNSSKADHGESDAPTSLVNGRSHVIRLEDEEKRYNQLQLFRPESAPTVMDDIHSPETSQSGHMVRTMNTDLNGDDDEMHRMSHDDEHLGPNCGKMFTVTPDGMGRYSCDECGKIFKHPGSLQHHRHIHRGTHRCPSCGKAFSRRWDMERHLNKSKYGCPANRFNTNGGGSLDHSPMTPHNTTA